MQEILNATENISESETCKLCWQMILNKYSVEHDDQHKASLSKGLRCTPTPNGTRSVENVDYGRAVLGERYDVEYVLPKN